ncbi:MAG: N-acetylmuramoyl-L-alanine amidase [Bacteroidetes bacterium]|nr:N-acetylmuramoyl-L-alanine amidase [Bacteroidota bacterium]
MVLILIATITSVASPAPDSISSKIVSTKLIQTADSIEIRFRADRSIPAFQRPERNGNTIVLRLTGVVHADTALATTLAPAHITATADVIRTFLVYRLTVPPSYHTCSARRDGPRDVILTLSTRDASTAVTAGTEPPKAMRNDRSRWSLDVIVIDAGHGGVDAGAEGVNGVYEKDVTLSIAKRLRALLQTAMPTTKVVMTREDDTFVELYRRTQIANENNGKLFISIHCNSMPTKPHPAHGCETYILRPGRNDDAARVAARENASVKFERSQSPYASMTQDQLIVATMAQRSFVQLSEKLASYVQRSVRNGTPIEDRGVSQAGFFVLVGASMPNILFETAFLSNTSDAAYISSARGQQEMAASIVNAISSYAASYRSLLEK